MRKGQGRTRRQTQRWKKEYRKRRELHQTIVRHADDIIRSENFCKTKCHIQHGNMTVNRHCINVAEYSLAISNKLEKLGIRCKKDELIRGALLHDYFLYDWHDPDHVQLHRLHGFYHPGVALENAKKEYELTPVETEIIKKHMWPLTVVPPTCREAWIVTAADKWCSLLETIHVHKGHGAKKVGDERKA